MLFYGGDADFKLEAFVDLALLELGELGVELFDAAIEARLDCCEIVLGRHVLDDMGEHFANLLEGGFLWCHMRGVYHNDESAQVRPRARGFVIGFALSLLLRHLARYCGAIAG
jgi:hypothetical protein